MNLWRKIKQLLRLAFNRPPPAGTLSPSQVEMFNRAPKQWEHRYVKNKIKKPRFEGGRK